MQIRLTPLTTEYAAFILALLTDPDWLRYIGDKGVFDLPSATKFIQQREQARVLGLPSFFVVNKDEQAIGLCTFLQRDYLQLPDVGYGFLPSVRGKGYARKAVQLLLEKCKQHTDLKNICAIVAANNQASINLLTRLDFTHLGAVQSAEHLSQVFSRPV